jgi:hypothetical protein
MAEYSTSSYPVPEVLGLFGQLAMRASNEIIANIQSVFTQLIKPTAAILEENPDFCIELNVLLAALAVHCTAVFGQIPRENVVLFMDCVKWGCCRPEPAIADRSIQILVDLLNMIEQRLSPEFWNEFLEYFGLDLTMMTFRLLSDSIHRYAFLHLMGLARRLMTLMTVTEDLISGFCELFPDKSPMELYEFVMGLVEVQLNYFQFKNVLRDFLIEVKKFSPRDPALYQLEKEEIEKRIKEKKEVPGLVPQVSDETNQAVDELIASVSAFSLRKPYS